MTTEDKSAARRGVTPSQTVGPFFHYCLTPNAYGYAEVVTDDLLTEDAAGERIRIEGRVFDGDGQPITDAMIEIWQADGEGRYASPADTRVRPNTRFKGFGRSALQQRGRLSLHDGEAGLCSRPGRPCSGAARQCRHLRARPAQAAVYAHLFRR